MNSNRKNITYVRGLFAGKEVNFMRKGFEAVPIDQRLLVQVKARVQSLLKLAK